MDRYQLVVLYNPVEGKDQEFNDWLDKDHIPELLALDEIVAAQRFELSFTQSAPPGQMTYRYMTQYEIETDDLEAFHEMLMDTRKDRAVTDAVDRPNNLTRYYRALGPRRTPPAG